MEDPEEVLTTVTPQPLMSIEDEEVAVVHQEVGEAMNLAEAIEVDPQIVEVTEAEVLMNEVDTVETEAVAIEEDIVADIEETAVVAIVVVIAAVIVVDIVEGIEAATAEETVEAIVVDIAVIEVAAIGVVIEEGTAVALTAVMEIGEVTEAAVEEVAVMTVPSMKLGRVTVAAVPLMTTTGAHAVMTATVVRLHQSARGGTIRNLPEVMEAHLLVDHHHRITTKIVTRHVVTAVRRHLRHPAVAAVITRLRTIIEIQDRRDTEAGHQFLNDTVLAHECRWIDPQSDHLSAPQNASIQAAVDVNTEVGAEHLHQ